MASGRSGNRRRMKIQAGPSRSRRGRLQFILFQRQGSGSLSHSGGADWSLGEGVGEWATKWEELASEIAHLQSLTFSVCSTPVAHSGGCSGRWMTQIGIFSRGQLRGRKGPGHFVPAILPSQACRPATARALQVWNLAGFCPWCTILP